MLAGTAILVDGTSVGPAASGSRVVTMDMRLPEDFSADQTIFARPADRAIVAPAPSAVVHVLYLLSSEALQRAFPIGAGGLTVGRVLPNDIVLESSAVSRRHCRLEMAGDVVQLVDLGSTNGTFVDGEKLSGTRPLTDDVRLQIGPFELRYERKRQVDMDAAEDLDRDLTRALAYVNALLPAPISDGPVQAAWFFRPCATLGGDAFGYQMVGPDCFIAYMLDVSGHGVGAAVHSVSVMNVMRQRALPGIDPRDPAAVLSALNAMFDMDTHHNLYFTLWYCCYHIPTRTLDYASAGHHAALLSEVANQPQVMASGRKHPAIGMHPGHVFTAERLSLLPASRLYLFSDGAFEINPVGGPPWDLQSMIDVLRVPATPGVSAPERLYRAARAVSPPGPLEDDFSVLELHFP